MNKLVLPLLIIILSSFFLGFSLGYDKADKKEYDNLYDINLTEELTLRDCGTCFCHNKYGQPYIFLLK